MADIRVYFATNRNHQPQNKSDLFGKHFNPDGVAALRFGHADYRRGKKGPVLEAVDAYPDTPAEGSGRFMAALHQAMSGERSDTLVFIHGFNVSFKGALAAGAELADQVKVADEPDKPATRPVNVVVFSWPSDGEAIPQMSYYSDREDARVTGPALARAYLKLRDFIVEMDEKHYCERRLHLLCHSMGNYVLRNGLQALIAKDPNALTRLFDQIIMAAPDEDDDAFELDSKLRQLPRWKRRSVGET